MHMHTFRDILSINNTKEFSPSIEGLVHGFNSESLAILDVEAQNLNY